MRCWQAWEWLFCQSWGVLSELALGSLSIVNIAGFPLRRSWCVVYPQARHPTPAMRAFIDYVQQNIRRFEQLFLRGSEQ